ncbi:hypothetical protein HispidOSU_031398 [Sigmodon hispidus]
MTQCSPSCPFLCRYMSGVVAINILTCFLPTSSLARWANKNMQHSEDLKSVIQRLSTLGPIVSVTPCGRQSAVVVFKDTISACKAVSAFQKISAGVMFQCSWQHRFMSRNVRISIAKILI